MVKFGLKQRKMSKIAPFSYLKRPYLVICFRRKLPISPNVFYDQCFTSDISFKYMRECDFITFCHCVELILRFLRRTQNNMQNVTIVGSSDAYGKLKCPVQKLFSMICFHFHKV